MSLNITQPAKTKMRQTRWQRLQWRGIALWHHRIGSSIKSFFFGSIHSGNMVDIAVRRADFFLISLAMVSRCIHVRYNVIERTLS